MKNLLAGLLLWLATALAVGIAGWSATGRAADRETDPPPSALEPLRVYTVRGEVSQVPSPDRPAAEFRVRHEAIDDFVGATGSIGMNSMDMPFPLANGVSVAGLEVGDKVELTLEVRWGRDRVMRTTRVRELPAGTALEFRPARPPSP